MNTIPGPHEARRELRLWLHETDLTTSAVAEWCGVSQSTVSRWLSECRPEEPYRTALELLSDGRVKAEWWLLPEEHELLTRARALRTGTD